MHEIDIDKNGEIDFDEFITVMSRNVQPAYTAEDLKHSFKVFTGDSPETVINLKKLERNLLEYCSEKLSREKLQKLLQQVSRKE